ncbi:hypothetical protein MHU86_15101 [Fragilaria crotonensis]|nr:hypothetical protein MHU86_15101 [Fragilaria crotonensis]
MLSQDFAPDDAALTDLITKNCSPFVPQNFRIIPLRPALISQIGGWLQLLPKTQLLPTQPVPSAIAAGAVTKDSSDESTESGGSLFSKDSDEKRKQKRPSGRTASLPTTSHQKALYGEATIKC